METPALPALAKTKLVNALFSVDRKCLKNDNAVQILASDSDDAEEDVEPRKLSFDDSEASTVLTTPNAVNAIESPILANVDLLTEGLESLLIKEADDDESDDEVIHQGLESHLIESDENSDHESPMIHRPRRPQRPPACGWHPGR